MDDRLSSVMLRAALTCDCAFGGPNFDILYVTTPDGRLYRVPTTGRSGYLESPPSRPYIPRAS
jgi:hypothetical protein